MGGSLLAVLAALVLFAAPAHAADLFLTGEREVYLAVDKLNAMGRLPGFLAHLVKVLNVEDSPPAHDKSSAETLCSMIDRSLG